jgi:ribosomal protein S18 acetylase RimI-like enzyme
MLIRSFDFSRDLEATRTLWEASVPGVKLGRSDTSVELLKKLERDPDLFLVAEEQGQLIGTVIGGFDGRRGMVYHLAVAASQQGQGIGSALMTELERRLKNKGCLKAYLLVVPENVEVAAFYEKRGWQAMPVTIMGKELA